MGRFEAYHHEIERSVLVHKLATKWWATLTTDHSGQIIITTIGGYYTVPNGACARELAERLLEAADVVDGGT